MFCFFSVLKKFLFVERPENFHSFSPGNAGTTWNNNFNLVKWVLLSWVVYNRFLDFFGSNRFNRIDPDLMMIIFTGFDGQERIFKIDITETRHILQPPKTKPKSWTAPCGAGLQQLGGCAGFIFRSLL